MDQRDEGNRVSDAPSEFAAVNPTHSRGFTRSILPSGNQTGGASEGPAATGTSMENLLTQYESEPRKFRVGDIVDGTVARVNHDEILIDIGLKSEGVLLNHEVQEFAQSGTAPKVGERVLVSVVQPEGRDGYSLVSLARARAEQGWRDIQKLAEEGAVVEADVVDFNRGGLVAEIEGVRGFVPMSQILGVHLDGESEQALDDKLQAAVGQKIWVKVIEVNRRRNRLILSERVASQERRTVRKDQLITELQEGEIRQGRVSSICDFGVFVDLGGADGLVHLSELGW